MNYEQIKNLVRKSMDDFNRESERANMSLIDALRTDLEESKKTVSKLEKEIKSLKNKSEKEKNADE